MLKKTILLLFIHLNILPAFPQTGWKKLNTSGAVTARSNASMIHHPGTGRIIVFGGNTSTGFVNELWSLDLSTQTWSLIPVKSGYVPPPRHTHLAFYDPEKDRMLIWSGQGSMLFNDVWAFQFSDSTWVNLFADGNVAGAPLKRYGSAAVYDPVKRRLVNFAGFTTSGRFEDTWSFHADSLSWKDHTNNPHPLKRCLTSQCYAEDRGKMIVYAGQSGGNLDDIWSLDLDAYSWTDLTPAFKPQPRHFSSLVYTGNGNVVMFGGNASGGLNDLWKFSLDKNTWDTIQQGVTKPDKRHSHAMLYISQQDKLVLFGGNGSMLYGDTWIFDGLSSVLGIPEKNPMGKPLFVFPNPAKETVNIVLPVPVQDFISAQLYTGDGKVVESGFHPELHSENETKITVGTGSLADGLHFVLIQTAGTSFLVKVIVKKN